MSFLLRVKICHSMRYAIWCIPRGRESEGLTKNIRNEINIDTVVIRHSSDGGLTSQEV